MITVSTLRQQAEMHSKTAVVRGALRDAAVMLLSVTRSIERTSNWIRFPYYHHVFSDERAGFERQLRYLRNFGEYLGLDDAVELLASGAPIDGRYFCITFDDGLKSCYDEALPALLNLRVPAAFFVVTSLLADSPRQPRIVKPLHPKLSFNFEYLTWQECAEMARQGMTIGSHTDSHRRLRDLTTDELENELRSSKAALERVLGLECKHFAAPWGTNNDIESPRDANVAERLGYRSFLTTSRGRNEQGRSPYMIRRDHAMASWPNAQLRYFLSA